MNVILSFERLVINIYEKTILNVCCISNILFILILGNFILYSMDM
jgi:hypothetical protein